MKALKSQFFGKVYFIIRIFHKDFVTGRAQAWVVSNQTKQTIRNKQVKTFSETSEGECIISMWVDIWLNTCYYLKPRNVKYTYVHLLVIYISTWEASKSENSKYLIRKISLVIFLLEYATGDFILDLVYYLYFLYRCLKMNFLLWT